MGSYFTYGYGLFIRLTHVISFLVWANWLVKEAMAQELSGEVSSTVSFLDAGLTSLGHIAAFTNCFLRGRLDVEMASRDLLVSLDCEELVEVGGSGGSSDVMALGTTSSPGAADAVLITTNFSNSVMRSFMKHASSCYAVDSLVLKYLPLRLGALETAECLCNEPPCACWCLWATPEIIHDLVQRLPGNIKQLSPQLYLLPSLHCFKAGCHGCSDGMLYLAGVGTRGFRHGVPDTSVVGALSAMLELTDMRSYERMCKMCLAIPTFDATDDSWSRLLLKITSTKDEADRDLQMDAPEALDLYIKGQRSILGIAKWSLSRFSLLFPRFMEMVLNLALTGWFRVDGFSSALVSRRTVRNYVVNSIGNGLHGGVFLSQLDVVAHSSNVHICQRLEFRAPLASLPAIALMGTCVNVISAIWWMVAVALGKGLGSWSTTYTQPPSSLRLYALVAGIALALAMDIAHAYINRSKWRTFPLLWAAMGVQLLALLALASILRVLGVAVFGTWVFAVIQALAWMKWVVGALLLTNNVADQVARTHSGILVYSSAFLLTAILAAVGGRWK